ncbi:methyltransferase [Microbulbifer sp.]|uniref:methyltransferase n=1 Tax=Microbulbifer sp. TaxID=1908541 RepID=UPI002586974E|nr:methyltransferase [Microbulbifer sp.]
MATAVAPAARYGSDAQYRLFDLLTAPLRWEVLAVALELGIFDDLATPRTAGELAQQYGLDGEGTELLLNALVSLGVVGKQEGGYCVDGGFAPLLTSTSDVSMSSLLTYLGEVRHVSADNIIALLRDKQQVQTGPEMVRPEYWSRAVRGLRSFHHSIRNPIVMDILSGLPCWPDVKKLLDLGAGSESLAQDICAARPDIDTVIFDLPGVVDNLERRIADDARIKLRGGDMNCDDLGTGYDLIWASMVFYYARDLTSVMGRIRRALRPGGVLISFHEELNDDRTAPEFHVLGRLHAELKSGPLSVERGCVRAAAAEAGFLNVQSFSLETPFGQMELVIGTA